MADMARTTGEPRLCRVHTLGGTTMNGPCPVTTIMSGIKHHDSVQGTVSLCPVDRAADSGVTLTGSTEVAIDDTVAYIDH